MLKVMVARTSDPELIQRGGSGPGAPHLVHRAGSVALLEVHRSDRVGEKHDLEALAHRVEDAGADAVVGGESPDVQSAYPPLREDVVERSACLDPRPGRPSRRPGPDPSPSRRSRPRRAARGPDGTRRPACPGRSGAARRRRRPGSAGSPADASLSSGTRERPRLRTDQGTGSGRGRSRPRLGRRAPRPGRSRSGGPPPPARPGPDRSSFWTLLGKELAGPPRERLFDLRERFGVGLRHPG